MWTWDFWKQAIERAVKTFAQVFIGSVGAGVFGIMDIDWANVLSVAGLATLISLLTSIVSSRFGPDKESPSVV